MASLVAIPLLVYGIRTLGEQPARGAITFALGVMLVSIGAMALVGYVGLTGFVNRTTIHVDRRQLRLEHGPLPAFWAKPQQLESVEVKQLFVRTVAHGSTRTAGSARIEHRLCAALHDGSEVTLVERIELLAQALFLERVIETHLGIADDRAYDAIA